MSDGGHGRDERGDDGETGKGLVGMAAAFLGWVVVTLQPAGCTLVTGRERAHEQGIHLGLVWIVSLSPGCNRRGVGWSYGRWCRRGACAAT